MSGTAEPVSYPGNPSLPREVREKILLTFRHTLNLFKEGKTDDCLIGCDFILKMDPRFAPARQLMEKAKNPAADVDIGMLEAVVAATPTRQERASSVETDRLLVRAAESFNARDFDAAMVAAEQVLTMLPGNRDAAQILAKARQKKTAQPQFEVARQRALAALDGHRLGEGRAALERMRSLDSEHPAVALLERRLAAPPPEAEAGESTNPGLRAGLEPSAPDAGGLDALSLDSLSLDAPSPPATGAYVPPPPGPSDPVTGPLSLDSALSDDAFAPSGGASSLWGDAPVEEVGDLALDAPPQEYTPASAFSSAPEPSPAYEPEPPSPQQEIEGLLAQGDQAARAGNRQQAIEVWSRIFLIDINNSEAVGRIEQARQEMAEGNKRVADSLKRGRERFEAGDFTGAREAFLEVLAHDEGDATARSYLDRIEQQLARPSAGLDLSRKAPPSDILAEEMAEAAEPEPAAIAELRPKAEVAEKPARRPMDKRFVLALGGALVLALAVGAYFLMRPSREGSASAAASGGPSLEHATMLFREGKVAETIAELRQIPASNPDYARARKLLASLTRNADGAEAPAGSTEVVPEAERPAPSSGPSPEAMARRAAAEKALEEKRYIDALKEFNLAAPAFQEDPTFAQALGAAAERVSELTPAVKLYNEGEYETAIPILWRLHQADKTNQDARSYLLRCYYNQGIAQLQNGLYPKAVESFGEVVSIAPEDTDAARHKKFAERYLKGDLDLMGRIYVRHLQQRP